MLRSICIGLWFAVLPVRAADLAQAQIEAQAGDSAYEAGDFVRAAEHYRAALGAGLDHANVHYNLGNAYYKQGELGKAIAAYERAVLRDPRHGAVRANLERARQQTRDEAFAPLQLPRFLQPLGWVYERVALNEWAMLAFLALSLAAVARIVGQWSRRWRARLRPYGWLALGVALLALSLAALHTRRDFGRERGVVSAEEVDVRSGPGTSYNLSFKIHEGLTVFVSERRGEWVQIHLGGQLVGWIPAAQIEII